MLKGFKERKTSDKVRYTATAMLPASDGNLTQESLGEKRQEQAGPVTHTPGKLSVLGLGRSRTRNALSYSQSECSLHRMTQMTTSKLVFILLTVRNSSKNVFCVPISQL